MRKNKVRELMKQGKPTIGTRVISTWPGVIEIIGHSGVIDYVEFVSQYGPYDLHDFDNIARASELVGISSMIKIDQEPRTYLAERALKAGIQNVLFADIRTVEDSIEAVRAVRPEPKGIMGIGNYRTRGYGLGIVGGSAVDLVKSLDDTVVALMIEKKEAVENLEEILSVEGVDMVQFGPSDYSMSLGLPGERNHQKVKEAELKVIKTALKLGVAPRVEIYSVKEAQRYIDLGVRHFSIGTDLEILYKWWREKGKNLRTLLSQVKKI